MKDVDKFEKEKSCELCRRIVRDLLQNPKWSWGGSYEQRHGLTYAPWEIIQRIERKTCLTSVLEDRRLPREESIGWGKSRD